MTDLTRLDRLIAWLDGSEPTAFYVAAPPRKTGPNSFAMGHTDYTRAMDELWATFVACGFDPSSAPDYDAWEAKLGRKPEDVDFIARLSRADLFVLLTKCARGERFSDGFQASLIDRGIFLAIARRLRVLSALDFT